MKKIIDGKRYDTETADCVCDISGRYANDRGNFNWNDTYLYRTKRGNWFIAGKGNALSRWATSYGNGSGPGSGLTTIDADEARDFVERYGTVDDCEKYFAVEEG